MFAAGRVDGVHGQRPHDQGAGRRVERESQSRRFSTSSARSISIAKFVDQARAVRLNNSSCQVYMALKPGVELDESLRRFAVQLDGPAVPHRVAAEPRRHQPHVFVLLSAHAAGQRSLADRVEHQRQLRRLGQPVAGRVRGQQARPGRNDARRPGEIRSRHSRANSTTPKLRRRCTFQHYTQARAGGQLRHQVRRAGRQPGHSAANRRAVSRRQRGHHHVGLAGGDELRRDRGQRRRRAAAANGRRNSPPAASARVHEPRPKSTPRFRTASRFC